MLTIGWLASNGQTGPVFQYTNPSKDNLRSLALEQSPKGYAYREYLVEVVSLALADTLTLSISFKNIDWIFDHLDLEEIYFEEGEYQNSGYDPTTKKMDPSLGHKKTMFVWVLRVGSYAIPLIKGDCGNILIAKVIRTIKQSSPIKKDISLIPSTQEDGFRDKEISFSVPKNLRVDSKEIPDKEENPNIPKDEKKWNLRPVFVVAGVTVGTVTLGSLAYFLIKKANQKPPIISGDSGDSGGPVGVPGHE